MNSYSDLIRMRSKSIFSERALKRDAGLAIARTNSSLSLTEVRDKSERKPELRNCQAFGGSDVCLSAETPSTARSTPTADQRKEASKGVGTRVVAHADVQSLVAYGALTRPQLSSSTPALNDDSTTGERHDHMIALSANNRWTNELADADGDGADVHIIGRHNDLVVEFDGQLAEERNDGDAKHCLYDYRFRSDRTAIESVNDLTSDYYRRHFHGFEHSNYLSLSNDSSFALSLRKLSSKDHAPFYRVILRTCASLVSLRATLHDTTKSTTSARELVEWLLATLRLPLASLRLAVPACDDALLTFDEKLFACNQFKIGVLYQSKGRFTEDLMYSTRNTSPAFDTFLSLLGTRVRLKGFQGFRGGLDVKQNTTGRHSLYTRFLDRFEVMFHVSVWLPLSEAGADAGQQIDRKRHIGNDIVTIVFQDDDCERPFDASAFRSHFQHIFLVVRAVRNGYRVALAKHKQIPFFGPKIKPFYTKRDIKTFILTKAINGERAAQRHVPAFKAMQMRSRQHALRECYQMFASSLSLSSTSTSNRFLSMNERLISKFKRVSSLSFNSRPTLNSTAAHAQLLADFLGQSRHVSGAVVWPNVFVVRSTIDRFSSKTSRFYVAICRHFLVLFDAFRVRELITCRSIIGWQTVGVNCLRIYFHKNGDSVEVSTDADANEDSAARDVIAEIKQRLSALTDGCETKELILKRNSSGNFGFHIQSEGLVTDVDLYSYSYESGLRVMSRIVEICKIALNTLNYEEVIDLLKTSITVSVTVLPPNESDSSPKRGCFHSDCLTCKPRKAQRMESDYENVSARAPNPPNLNHYFQQRRAPVLPSPKPRARLNYGSGSTSTTSSSLQEDLIKLLTSSDDNENNNAVTVASSESSSPLDQRSTATTATTDDEVIITTAHPAKVISSRDLDWPSLVSTATNFFEDEEDDERPLTATTTASTGGQTSTTLVNELEETVAKLSRDKDQLQHTIERLRAENQRLHYESETASHQLRKFTEWFFNSHVKN